MPTTETDRELPDISSTLRVETLDGVAVVTLDRPDRRNAIDGELTAALLRAASVLDGDPAVRALVLTGAPPGFCAGSDVKELSELKLADVGEHEARAGAMARSLRTLSKPVVAAVEGFAIGGGFLLAVSCDVVVAAADSRWHLPEVALGWIPPWGLQALASRVGVAPARRLAWSMLTLNGTEAGELGVADEVVEPGNAKASAVAVARQLAALPPSAVQSTKRALGEMEKAEFEAVDARAAQLFVEDCCSEIASASFGRFASTLAEGP